MAQPPGCGTHPRAFVVHRAPLLSCVCPALEAEVILCPGVEGPRVGRGELLLAGSERNPRIVSPPRGVTAQRSTETRALSRQGIRVRAVSIQGRVLVLLPCYG